MQFYCIASVILSDVAQYLHMWLVGKYAIYLVAVWILIHFIPGLRGIGRWCGTCLHNMQVASPLLVAHAGEWMCMKYW